MTRDQALKFIMPFGKFKGKTLGFIYADDENYLNWLLENVDAEEHPELLHAVDLVVGT